MSIVRKIGRGIAGFGRFAYDFVVGDDWTVAVAVVFTIALVTVLAHNGHNPWPLLLLAVAATLSWSVGRVARAHNRKRAAAGDS
jgi:hypothetical protein